MAPRAEGVVRVLVWVERLLVGAGLVMLAGAALVVADAHVAQTRARSALAAMARPTPLSSNLPDHDPVSAREVDARAPEPAPSIPLASPPSGTPIGDLSIPRVHMSAVILQGSDARTLRRGPGHLEHSALPGEAGNIAVAGHRDTFFRPLREVRVGDDVFVETPERRFHYRVSTLKVVGPRDVSVLGNQGASTLTLVTCYPFWMAGPAPDRYVVMATEVGGPDVIQPRRQTVAARPDIPAETQVRQAIARFQSTYNARLERRPEPGATALALGDCAVAIHGSKASASCEALRGHVDGPDTWHFALRSTEGMWNLVSVEPQ